MSFENTLVRLEPNGKALTIKSGGKLTAEAGSIVNLSNLTTLNVGTAATVTPKGFNGLSSALKAYLNFGVPTATDIDGDATITVDGTIVITWTYNGDL